MNIERIREDFPILQRKIKGKPIIYFDNACMSLRPKQVIEAINRYYNEFPACGGRSLHKLGKKVTEEVEKSRKSVQKFFNAKSHKEIIFTKNTTESINLVMNSLNFSNGDIVMTTDKEHNSNLLPCLMLAKKGTNHEIIKSNEDNTFNLENFREKINRNVKLVSMVHTSNLDGVSIPAREIIKIAHDHGALVLLDAAQSAPHKEIDVRKLDADFLACSGHKMLGPSGMGVLYGKYHLLEKMRPFIIGGDTVKDTTYETMELELPPEKFEAGLQDYAGIIGIGEAADYLMKVGREDIEKHEIMLNKKITESLISNKTLKNSKGIFGVPGMQSIPVKIKLIGPKNPELRGGIFSFNIQGMDFHNIAIILDESHNIAIRSGAHCVHSWFNAHNMKGSARASLYLYNTEEEAEIFAGAVKKLAEF